jgi:hypothetical protein
MVGCFNGLAQQPCNTWSPKNAILTRLPVVLSQLSVHSHFCCQMCIRKSSIHKQILHLTKQWLPNALPAYGNVHAVTNSVWVSAT